MPCRSSPRVASAPQFDTQVATAQAKIISPMVSKSPITPRLALNRGQVKPFFRSNENLSPTILHFRKPIFCRLCANHLKCLAFTAALGEQILLLPSREVGG